MSWSGNGDGDRCAKLIPDPSQTSENLASWVPRDKQGSAYLEERAPRSYQTLQRRCAKTAVLRPCRRKCVEAFLQRSQRQDSHFTQGLYTYQSDWKGALNWLRERLNEAPSEKIRFALEELVSPTVCSECKGRRLRSDSLVRTGRRARYRGIHFIADRGCGRGV